jgi:hypothetical protein
MRHLYQIERTLLTEHDDVRHFRYDIVNTLTGGNVLTMHSTRNSPPSKLVHRCARLNETWVLTRAPKKVAPSVTEAVNAWFDAFDPFTATY